MALQQGEGSAVETHLIHTIAQQLLGSFNHFRASRYPNDVSLCPRLDFSFRSRSDHRNLQVQEYRNCQAEIKPHQLLQPLTASLHDCLGLRHNFYFATKVSSSITLHCFAVHRGFSLHAGYRKSLMLIKVQGSSSLYQRKFGSPNTGKISFRKLHSHPCTGRMNLNWNVCRKELEGSLGSERPFKRLKQSSLFSLGKLRSREKMKADDKLTGEEG